MQIPNPYANYPPLWLDYDSRAGIARAAFNSAAEVNRFGARYRLAKSFRRLDLDGYTDGTARGYDALTRVTLVWSAFESLLIATGRSGHDIPRISAALDFSACLNDLRAADPGGRFLAFVLPKLTSRRQRTEVEKYLAGQSCCAMTLAQAVRHIFVHGPLTPNSNQADPEAVVQVCERLSAMLFRFMDQEFHEAVNELKRIAPDREASDDIPY